MRRATFNEVPIKKYKQNESRYNIDITAMSHIWHFILGLLIVRQF